jgi:hypothetical protein
LKRHFRRWSWGAVIAKPEKGCPARDPCQHKADAYKDNYTGSAPLERRGRLSLVGRP